MTNSEFKVVEVDRDETCPSGDGSERGDPFIVFYAIAPQIINPDELEERAVEAVLNEVGDRFSFCETERVNERTIEVTAFRF